MPVADGNLFANLPSTAEGSGEQFLDLFAHPGLRIERIVSTGEASPAGFWYDQPQTEWVIVLQGEAGVQFADEPAARCLRPGDFLAIAPHRRHRVAWTAPGAATVWLAVHHIANPSTDQAV